MPSLSMAGTFVAVGNMTHARDGATATLLPDGKVLIAGGDEYVGVPVFAHLVSAELYDPSTRTFTRTGSMKAARSGADAVLLRNGKVLIVGGEGCKVPARCTMDNWAGSVSLNSAELYDPGTGKFTPTGSMLGYRPGPITTLLPDGRVLVFDTNYRLVEAYNPATGKFSRAGTVSDPYGIAAANTLPDGKVLVVGGDQPGLWAQLFDPGTGLSTTIPVPSLGADRDNFVEVGDVISLADGRVLVWAYRYQVGVTFHPDANYLYTYDPATESFAKAAPFDGPAGWSPSGGILLRDGRILFAGGSLGLDSTDLAGLYDPSSGFHLLDSRLVHAGSSDMIALSDGTVLIVDGEGWDILSSAELFVP